MSLSSRVRSSMRRFTERRGQDTIAIAPAAGKVIHAGSRNLDPSLGLRMIRCRAPPCSMSPTTSTDSPTSGWKG